MALCLFVFRLSGRLEQSLCAGLGNNAPSLYLYKAGALLLGCSSDVDIFDCLSVEKISLCLTKQITN